jgi:Fe-S-cluster-containing dehydrogenase component/DMSO reductase anchor subunit
MRNGFIFNHNKCVNCNACSAACILENGWDVRPRNIYIYNSEACGLAPVINLSLACNHCESAVCMKSCPASAYTRDSLTGAVIIDESKCIGCKYCQWNCPYDAPKFNIVKKTVEKCHLCFSSLAERRPACTSACPTGALSYNIIQEHSDKQKFNWFPDKKLNPSLQFTGDDNAVPLKIVPEIDQEDQEKTSDETGKNISGEYSLVLFSFMATLSVSTILISLIKGVFPPELIFLPLLITAGLVSFLHLGKVMRSWRSLMNIRYSPLSREIAVFIIYGVLSLITVFYQLPALLIISSVTGIVLLLSIDNVYVYASNSRAVIFHSGQSLLSALTIVSFVSGSVVPFTFIALVRLGISTYRLSASRKNKYDFGLRFLRIAILIVTGLSLISNNAPPEILTVLIFLAGEFIDRNLFYVDFNPINIKTLIIEKLNNEINEKKRNK